MAKIFSGKGSNKYMKQTNILIYDFLEQNYQYNFLKIIISYKRIPTEERPEIKREVEKEE